MRLVCEFILSGEYLPIDYRRGFLSLIKAALEKGDRALYEEFYLQPTIKPFTFSIHFPGLVGLENESFRVGSRAKMTISTSEAALMALLYNGLRIRSLYPYPIFDNTLMLQKISAVFPPKILASSAQFKTVSPVLIKNKKESNWYLMPHEEGFSEGLAFNIRELAKTFLGQENVSFTFEPLHFREKKVFHYGQFMRGYHGYFEMAGRAELLNLIRDIGLGNRRSQGFGMVDIVGT